ncbi:G2/mitotic-specific cyclin [Thecaphora frezii]
MSSNIVSRRAPVRTRSTTVKASENGATGVATRATRLASYKDTVDVGTDAGPSKPVVAAVNGKATSAAAGGVLGTRKRAALGDLTNANRTRAAAAAAAGGKDDIGKGKAALKDGARSKATTATATNGASTGAAAGGARRVVRRPDSTAPAEEARVTRPSRRTGIAATATSTATTNGRATATTSTAARRTTSSRATSATATAAATARPAPSKDAVQQLDADSRDAVMEMRESKRIKTEKPAKDEGWEDLDAEDMDDPLMVAEYVNDIFDYMKELEIANMPNPDYMSMQRDINWQVRGILVDWLIDVHAKFRLLPETLFLALNIIDRFLSQRMITLSKLQLVGVTAMFIAAKYEEVLCPSVENFVYLADGGYTDAEILAAERYMLKVLGFNLSYANPMNFLRRISKADNYDIQTRTVAKYFMEISLVDYRLMEHPPSLIAAAAVWLAREVLERGEWTPTLVHYSTYSEEELLGTAEIMLDYCLRPIAYPFFHKKYSAKKFMRASTYVAEWARSTFPEAVVLDEEAEEQDLSSLRVDLFERRGLERPDFSPVASSRGVTPLDDCRDNLDATEEGGGCDEGDESRSFDDDDHRAALRDVTNEYDSTTY